MTSIAPSPGSVTIEPLIGVGAPEAERKRRSTHEIVEADGRVQIKRVELFAEMEDGPLGAVGESDLDDIAEFLVELMDQGRFSQVVIEHQREGEADRPRESVGIVTGPITVEKSGQNGKATLYGTLDLNESDFENYIASNRFPRRSAEITNRKVDGGEKLWMSQVALIGRLAPRADLPDVYVFATDDSAAIICGEKEPNAMKASELTGKIGGVSFQDETPDDLEKAAKEARKFADSCDAARKKMAGDEKPKDDKDKTADNAEPDDDEKKDEKEKSADNSASPALKFSDPNIQARFDLQAEQIHKLSVDLGEERKATRMTGYASKLTELAAAGVQFSRDDEMARLEAKSPAEAESHLGVIEANYARSNGHRMVDASRNGAAIASAAENAEGVGDAAMFTEDTREKIVKETERRMGLDENRGRDVTEVYATVAREMGATSVVGAEA